MMRRQNLIPGRERMRWRRLNSAPMPEPAADPMGDVLATMAQRMPEFLAMPAAQLSAAERQAAALERLASTADAMLRQLQDSGREGRRLAAALSAAAFEFGDKL